VETTVTKTGRKRLDLLLVERGLAETRQKASAMILAGEVSVDDKRIDKAGAAVLQSARIEVASRLQKYASRGGLKLEGALDDFQIHIAGRVCLDLGASTGGFTDCLLQHGASCVFAVDVNVDQMAWKLQQDARVIRIKKNARELRLSDIAEPAELVVADLSFISVTKVLPAGVAAAREGADFLILVKPQFELRREEVGPGGIVSDKGLHIRATESVRRAAEAAGLQTLGLQPSRLRGAEGNQEYFLHARKRA
jgi:23S rRNA (cytidine1920-2'-O)/16S rRNA (cytidine1409-2'-O)-methyltransferase